MQGVGARQPPSDRAVGERKEADVPGAVTHTFLLTREPVEEHRSQGLGSRWTIEVPSGFSFFDHDSCVQRRLQVEPRRVQSVGGFRFPLPGSDSPSLCVQACFPK